MTVHFGCLLQPTKVQQKSTGKEKTAGCTELGSSADIAIFGKIQALI